MAGTRRKVTRSEERVWGEVNQKVEETEASIPGGGSYEFSATRQQGRRDSDEHIASNDEELDQLSGSKLCTQQKS